MPGKTPADGVPVLPAVSLCAPDQVCHAVRNQLDAIRAELAVERRRIDGALGADPHDQGRLGRLEAAVKEQRAWLLKTAAIIVSTIGVGGGTAYAVAKLLIGGGP